VSYQLADSGAVALITWAGAAAVGGSAPRCRWCPASPRIGLYCHPDISEAAVVGVPDDALPLTGAGEVLK
jgi:hypothetical protein